MHTPAQDPDRLHEFATFMQDYQDMVYSTAMRLLGQTAHAEDIAQDVFLKAFEHFDRLRDSNDRGGWLKTVAINLSLNHLSRYRKRWRLFGDFRRHDAAGDAHAGDAPADIEVPDRLLEDLVAEERQRIVEQSLARLPDHQRVPLVLFHFDELPYQEIARRLSISLAKVKIDILRGRSALAKIIVQSTSFTPGSPGSSI